MKLIKCILLILILGSGPLFSQVVLLDLEENTAIIKENQKPLLDLKISKDLLNLPFVDDFSASQVFPNNALWLDKKVFVNGDYPVNPYTINVATFDALDSTGSIYKHATITPFQADTLTSKKIYILNKPNLVFSFFYQPQGIGNAPEKTDSLVLEFYSDQKKQWRKVWSDTGTTYQRFYQTYKRSFKYVAIPVNDTAFYKESFQFRFYNYASLSNTTLGGARSNCDQWHIDYVYLDSSRTLSDSTVKDLAVSKEGTSFLANYYAMPWRQFNVNAANEIRATTDISICNLDKVVNSTNYHYEIYKNSNYLSSNSPVNIPAINPYEIKNLSMSVASGIFPVDNGNTIFTVKKIITDNTANLVKTNDTVCFLQDFNNYYAYDDCNPESGIGLTPANSKLALKFTLNTPDTLRAVQIYFNGTYNNANEKFFKLVVWKTLDPEVILYTKGGYKPVFGEAFNCYHYYRLDNPLVLSGTFYVGIQQITDDYLNIGFDLNNDSKNNAYYKTSVTWEQVPFTGAIMMRPVLGSVLPPNASIKENNFATINIYPNPCTSGMLHIELPESADKSEVQIQILDIYGRMLLSECYQETIDLSAFSNGLYFVQLLNKETKEVHTAKLLISK
jgi:hypothetical protein